MRLAELAPDILLSQLFARRFEYLGCFPHLDEVTRSPTVRDIDSEKCGQIGDARSLLHLVGHGSIVYSSFNSSISSSMRRVAIGSSPSSKRGRHPADLGLAVVNACCTASCGSPSDAGIAHRRQRAPDDRLGS